MHVLPPHDARIPKYLKVMTYIRQMVESGQWQAHHQLPSEDELAARFSFSRGTVRQAIGELVSAGVLYRVHGRGTFTGPERIELDMDGSRFSSFLQSLDNRQVEYTVRHLGTVELSDLSGSAASIPDALIRAAIFPESGRPGNILLRIDRLRSSGGAAVMYSENYLPAARFPDAARQDFSGGAGLHAFLQRVYGVVIRRTRRTFTAAAAEGKLAGLLEVQAGTPLLRAEQVSCDQFGACVDYALIWMAGDRLAVTIDSAQYPSASGAGSD